MIRDAVYNLPENDPVNGSTDILSADYTVETELTEDLSVDDVEVLDDDKTTGDDDRFLALDDDSIVYGHDEITTTPETIVTDAKKQTSFDDVAHYEDVPADEPGLNLVSVPVEVDITTMATKECIVRSEDENYRRD